MPSKSTSSRNKCLVAFVGNCFKHQPAQGIIWKNLAPARKAEALVTCFTFLPLACQIFFFLIKKGKMGQLKRIFTTVRINTRPMQPHKLHFSSPFRPLCVALSVLYLEPSQRPESSDCPSISHWKDMSSVRREEDWCDPRIDGSLFWFQQGMVARGSKGQREPLSDPSWLQGHQETILIFRKYYHPRDNSEEVFKIQLISKSLCWGQGTR